MRDMQLIGTCLHLSEEEPHETRMCCVCNLPSRGIYTSVEQKQSFCSVHVLLICSSATVRIGPIHIHAGTCVSVSCERV